MKNRRRRAAKARRQIARLMDNLYIHMPRNGPYETRARFEDRIDALSAIRMVKRVSRGDRF